VAIVGHGTTAEERLLKGTLANIAGRAERAAVGTSALLFIGAVARYASARVRTAEVSGEVLERAAV
jgi:siroheme synthase